jgi:hypothetical protein
MREKWKVKCAKGVFILEWSELDKTWQAGEFPPVKEKVLRALMEKHLGLADKNEEEVDELWLKVLLALAWRATKKMNQKVSLIVEYVVKDVKRGKAPAKSLSPWTVELMEEVAKPIPVMEVSQDPGMEDGSWMLDGIQDWGQESAIRDARRHRERVAEGYVEVDLDGNPVKPR